MAKSSKKYVGDAKYLKKEDLPEPVNTYFLWVKEEEVTAPGKGPKPRLILFFDGLAKGLVLNAENNNTLIEITSTDDYEKWSELLENVPLQLYVDPDVTFGGKRVGGIRIRKLDYPDSVPVPKPKLKPKLVMS